MKPTTSFVGFHALKQAVTIVQVLNRYGLLDQMHRSGDSLSGPCPLHAGHDESQFRVSISKNCWICFTCHAGGSIIDFVSRKEGIGIREAALLIQDWFGVKPASNASPGNSESSAQGHPRQSKPARAEPTVNAPLRFTLSHLDPRHPYLAERGLSEATIKTFGLGYCSIGILAGRVVIPIHSATGQILAYAGRWPGEPAPDTPKYKLPPGFRKSLELFNQHRASAADARLPLVVVEGFFGCMSVWQAGYQRVVAIMGSMLSYAQEELILKLAGPGGRVILMFDEDEAGRSGRAEARTRLERWLQVNVLTFDKEGTQPDQLPSEEVQRLLGREPEEGVS